MKAIFRLISIVVSMTLTLVLSLNLHAQESRHILFAVDLSLDAQQRNTAYDVIQQTILSTPKEYSIGLTLFDDTVRRFVAPSMLNATQIRALHDAMANSPTSVRSSSNLAVGIERAIDNLEPSEPANLIVYSRGVIDTATQDPRARFSEWLELVLLPQATRNNITITLVTPHGQTTDPTIERAFDSSIFHSIVTSTPGKVVDASLISILGIENRPYGDTDTSLSPVTDTPVFSAPPLIDSTASGSTEENEPPGPNHWLLVWIALLVMAMILLCGFFYWRYRAKNALPVKSHSAITSSTYLPLTEKPVNTMKNWIDENDSQKNTSPDSRVETKQNERDPWD